MSEQIQKLSPDRDLQCYFLTPSAIAAMSGASESGYTLSGKWRQQFDWAVVEWNRDNVFDHPTLRPLPDGDLSDLVLTYQEQRTSCIPIESNLVPVVDWNNLRIWAPSADGHSETVYTIALNDPSICAPVSGNYVPASATLTLAASPGVGQRVGIALLEQHYYYAVGPNDGLSEIVAGIATNINQLSPTFRATSSGAAVTVSWALTDKSLQHPDLRGSNGNRLTMYGFAESAAAVWATPFAQFAGGQFPDTYRVTLDFRALKAFRGIPTDRVRKMRWTWAADLQPTSFEQTEFSVKVSNWQVTGSNRAYSVAGPGSRRIEDTDSAAVYSGSWSQSVGLESGNFSGSRIHVSNSPGDSVSIVYKETAQHQLLLGTRRLASAGAISVSVDGGIPLEDNLYLAGEDILVRLPLGTFSAGPHTVTVTNSGTASAELYFDFIEIAYATTQLSDSITDSAFSLSTDWDTYHSQSLPAERTAWMINKLGFKGRVNHYAGALWFYELVRTGTQYSSVTLQFAAQGSSSPNITLNLLPPPTVDEPSPSPTPVTHLVLPDDTLENAVQALAGLINLGTNLVWASANGTELTITARQMGKAGDSIAAQLDPSVAGYSVRPAAAVTGGGVDGTTYDLDSNDSLNATLMAAADFWKTDLNAVPRINRAARDWHIAYFTALKGYGIDVVTSFSTEMLNADPSSDAGLAQRYPDGTPTIVNTPAVQTNFSPQAIAYWQQVYLDMAALQSAAGLTPYLQFGEIQWWYFPKQIWNNSTAQNQYVGMPFYDQYTVAQFEVKYGRPPQVILSNSADPSPYSDELSFFSALLGSYTSAIRQAVVQQFPNCRWEVLYPTDTNNTPLNRIANFAIDDWTPSNLNSLKTESFGFTGSSNLDASAYSMGVSAAKGFPNAQRAHLIGIGDAFSCWLKESNYAQAQGLGSITLFALDQYCLIGYPLPPFEVKGKSSRAA